MQYAKPIIALMTSGLISYDNDPIKSSRLYKSIISLFNMSQSPSLRFLLVLTKFASW